MTSTRKIELFWPSPPRQSVNHTTSRSKREDIIYTAIEYFGKDGYEYTKWADVAKAVGIGSATVSMELLRSLVEKGELVQDNCEQWTQRLELNWDKMPTRVEAAIAERVGRLPINAACCWRQPALKAMCLLQK